jgi:hypothetical protein
MIDWVETNPDWLLQLATDGLWFVAASLLIAAAAGVITALLSCRRIGPVVPRAHQLGFAKPRDRAADIRVPVYS